MSLSVSRRQSGRKNEAEICKYVETDGTVAEENSAESKGIRLAMTLDPDRILFVSPTANDFSFYKDEEFRMVQNHFGVVSANTWKLTLQGGDETGAEVSSLDAVVSLGTFAPGNKVTLTHRAADMLSGATQVTAALYTESDGVLYYGRINDDVTATTSELTLPEEMKPGTYRLLVFGEDVNFGANTDYTTAVNLGEAIEFTIEPEYVMGFGDTLFSEKVGNSSYRNIKRDTCQTVEVDNHGIEPKVVNGKKRLTVPFTFTDSGSKTPATQVSFLIVGDAVGETLPGEEILMHGQVWYRVPEGETSLSFDLPEWYEGETIYVCTEKVTSGKTEGYASELVRLEFADVNWTENEKRDRIISIIVEEQTDASDECAVTLSDGRANDTVFSVDDFVISKTGSNRTDVEEGVTVEAINGKNQVQGAGEVVLTVKVDKEFEKSDSWCYLWWKKKRIGEFRVIKRVITTRNLEKTYNPKVGGSQLTAEEREELPILREAGSNAQILFYTDKECTTLVGSREDTVSGINYYGAMPPGAGKVGDEPIDAGTYYYRIEIFPSERNKGTVTTTRTFTIHKASATIKAADQTIEVGDDISQEPSIGLESCYIDTRMNYYVKSVVLTPDSLEMNVADNRIMPSDARIYCHKHWETVSVDVTKNFDITYEPGRLTVTEKVLVPTPTPEPDTDDAETETEPEPEPDSEPEPEGNKPEYEVVDIQKPDKPERECTVDTAK